MYQIKYFIWSRRYRLHFLFKIADIFDESFHCIAPSMADGQKRTRIVGEVAQEEEEDADVPEHKKQKKKDTLCVRDPHVERQALSVVGNIVKRICSAMAHACHECTDDELMINRLNHGAIRDIGDVHKLLSPLLLQIDNSSQHIAMDAADGNDRWVLLGFRETVMQTQKNHLLLNLVADIATVFHNGT